MDETDLCFTPALDLTALIDARELSPVELPFNLTGLSAASVPCGFTAEGLPVGLQIVGRWHADALVLRAAACFECLQPWAGRRPPVA